MTDQHNILQSITAKIRYKHASLFSNFSAHTFPLSRRRPPGSLPSGFLFIGEIKKASPSLGLLRSDFDPVRIAKEYEQAGASALSVLTEPDYFQGSLDDLKHIGHNTSLPLLRKDFIIHPYQIYESFNAGADIILLIAALLSKAELKKLHQAARNLNLKTLLEIRHPEELDLIKEISPDIVGINNRDLRTLRTDITHSLDLIASVPGHFPVISESGITSPEQISLLRNYGFSGVLIGTSVMTAEDRVSFMSHLFSRRPGIKICGLTHIDDLSMVSDQGADYAGFIFYPNSPRYIRPENAKRIIDLVPKKNLKYVGVFVDESPRVINSLHAQLGLDVAQLHGNYDKESLSQLKLPFWQARQIRNMTALRHNSSPVRSPILIDSYSPYRYGGTGRSLSPNIIRQAVRAFPSLIIAGGISPENIHIPLSYDPYAIDINSGVECSPGRKDPCLIKKLFQKIGSVHNA
ncbi:MAG TPA: hypothetical protein ENN72_05780 [Firmicutes bacterium]|nr:hypothetical protein [Bacillota bacterium]